MPANDYWSPFVCFLTGGEGMFIRAQNFLAPVWPFSSVLMLYTRRLFTSKLCPCFLELQKWYFQPQFLQNKRRLEEQPWRFIPSSISTSVEFPQSQYLTCANTWPSISISHSLNPITSDSNSSILSLSWFALTCCSALICGPSLRAEADTASGFSLCWSVSTTRGPSEADCAVPMLSFYAIEWRFSMKTALLAFFNDHQQWNCTQTRLVTDKLTSLPLNVTARNDKNRKKALNTCF